MRETVVVLDFGSQYTQLIVRRVRQLGVYCQILPHTASCEELLSLTPKALILSGSPGSAVGPDAADMDAAILESGLPVLGICYGMQILARMRGGVVRHARAREYGPAVLKVDGPNELFEGCGRTLDVWMSHGDFVAELPQGFSGLAHTSGTPIAAMGQAAAKQYGVQFHPEVEHTPKGIKILGNFLFRIAGCRGGWSMKDFIEDAVDRIRTQVGDQRVLCALSGGVDSAVTAALLNRAIGSQAVCVFVDNGLLRLGEAEQICRLFREEHPLNFRSVDAVDKFLLALRGVEDPEKKRKIIGEMFVQVFREEAARIGGAKFLAQGTLYPDVIESHSAFGGPSATIKTHHNVGGLPDDLEFELVEPLRELFKDEVRLLGRQLGLAEQMLTRQPFPGPGLAVRIIGAVTEDRLRVVREADARVQEELRDYDAFSDIWQSFAVLLPVKTVGVMGDDRTYANVVALRVVMSTDAMTADWARLPPEFLERMSSRIINEVEGVNRVVYDISPKPPSTIEWE